MCVPGCAGRADIHFIPLDTRKISGTGALVTNITPDECYYWVDDTQRLIIVMRERHHSPFGAQFSREILMSLVLDGLPADSSRDYRVNMKTLRFQAQSGYSRIRSASLNGIVRVTGFGTEKLSGRFRIQTKQQSYSVLTGWAGDARVFLAGEFTAKPNRTAGEAILLATEEGGLAR